MPEEGFAEADPSADVEGKDVMLKVIVLANHLWGTNLTQDDVKCEGISGLTETMVKEAVEQGQHWNCLLYTSPSPRDSDSSRMPSSA